MPIEEYERKQQEIHPEETVAQRDANTVAFMKEREKGQQRVRSKRSSQKRKDWKEGATFQIANLTAENETLNRRIADLTASVKRLESRLGAIDNGSFSGIEADSDDESN